jgi:hypothetical protein
LESGIATDALVGTVAVVGSEIGATSFADDATRNNFVTVTLGLLVFLSGALSSTWGFWFPVGSWFVRACIIANELPSLSRNSFDDRDNGFICLTCVTITPVLFTFVAHIKTLSEVFDVRLMLGCIDRFILLTVTELERFRCKLVDEATVSMLFRLVITSDFADVLITDLLDVDDFDLGTLITLTRDVLLAGTFAESRSVVLSLVMRVGYLIVLFPTSDDGMSSGFTWTTFTVLFFWDFRPLLSLFDIDVECVTFEEDRFTLGSISTILVIVCRLFVKEVWSSISKAYAIFLLFSFSLLKCWCVFAENDCCLADKSDVFLLRNRFFSLGFSSSVRLEPRRRLAPP